MTSRPQSISGSVSGVTGHEVEVRGLRLRLGDTLAIDTAGEPRIAEVVSVQSGRSLALVYGATEGLGPGDPVRRLAQAPGVVVGRSLIGRIVDALGRPLDGGPPVLGDAVELDIAPPPALERRRIDERVSTGIRVMDTLTTIGRGQRIGVFGGSGVGKSTLLGMLSRGSDAEITVVALVGERGREVREFVEDELGPDGLAEAVVVVATSDQPALLRLRAARYATRISEWFADQGRDVILLVDSITRLAMAQREIGLAAGEPPTARGYTPSVFSLLPKLLERAGPRATGTITGLYTVLVDGDDMNDPIADAVRGILDGHIVLDRKLAVQGRYPAVDPLRSLSRLAGRLVTGEEQGLAIAARDALAAAAEVQELVEVGAYVPGSNPRADAGLQLAPHLTEFFRQPPADLTPADEAWEFLRSLIAQEATA